VVARHPFGDVVGSGDLPLVRRGDPGDADQVGAGRLWREVASELPDDLDRNPRRTDRAVELLGDDVSGKRFSKRLDVALECR